MTVALYSNNAVSSLAGAITNVSLTANLSSGGGALFPHPGAGQYFTMTFNDVATGLLTEIVWVTNVTGDVITMIRGQEGTLAQNWNASDIASHLITAGGLQQFVQFPQMQAFNTNSGPDTGAANAYVVALNPVLTAYTPGMPIFWKALNANTGASTFNGGAGVLPLVNPDGTALGSGTVSPGGYYISVPDGAGHFQLISTSNQALSSQGVATTGDHKFRPTGESIPGWIPANALTIGNATSGGTGRANADAFPLFNWHWTNFSNVQCPVNPGGRGGSALADFNANKTIQILDWRGTSPVGTDTMGGAATTRLSGVPVTSGSATTPGSVIGENLHTLTLGETPTGITSSNASQSITASGANSITASGNNSITVSGNNSISASGANSITASGSNSISAAGSNSITASGSNTVNVTTTSSRIVNNTAAINSQAIFGGGAEGLFADVSAATMISAPSSGVNTINVANASQSISVTNASQAISVANASQAISVANAAQFISVTNASQAISVANASQAISVSGVNSISATSNNTGGGAHNNVPRSITVTWYLKL